ncbi:MAG TPA: 3-phosphoshikimate 1-carboxyvinyltransferase [Polyangiaceae bacterium]|nr:3-phosphoshikimate 1-carboxyvinyltransferase [Polyangiaceae bacterium]
MDYFIEPASRPLRGLVPVPSDRSIGHRALLVGAVARGPSLLRGFAYGGDHVSTIGALRALGVAIDDDGKGTVAVAGRGLRGLCEAPGPIDCGGSGATMRLLAGLLAGQPFATTLVGDESLGRRPMASLAGALRRRGATIEGAFHPTRAGEITAPLVVGPLKPKAQLMGCEETLAVASDEVKGALLLSGLYADGNTYVNEPLVSRDHTERLLHALGVPLRTVGTMVELSVEGWPGELEPFAVEVPGDLSAAAFLLVAAQLVPGSEVGVRRCGLNRTRAGVLDVLRDAGAGLSIEQRGDELGEPVGDVVAAPGEGRAFRAGGELMARAIDEVPALCALAARARGVSVIADAAELRAEGVDRLAAMAATLRAFGVECEEQPDGLTIEGRPDAPLRAADVESYGDRGVAMAATVLALAAGGPSRVRDVACVGASFPRFAGTLRALGASVRAGGRGGPAGAESEVVVRGGPR